MRYAIALFLFLLLFGECAMAQRPLNVPTQTLGGKQFWGDVYLYGGWRIQENVFTGHHRLLDPRDVRRAWGTRAQCEAVLMEARNAGTAMLASPRLCLLIHGYLRSKDSLSKLKLALEAEGFTVYAINYPSTQFDLDTLCRRTESLLAQVSNDFVQVNVVTHSMGGIIARGILSAAPLKGGGRLVMLAPPNQGARMADLLLAWWPSKYISGPAGKELATDAWAFARRAGIPASPYAIIAGGRGNDEGYNPAIPGDDDGIVGVDETRLAGAAAWHRVNAAHTFIMDNEDAIRHVCAFLRDVPPSGGGN